MSSGYSVRVRIEDSKLRALTDDVLPRLRAVVSIAAHNIERRGKEKVPVDTGATKDSIQPEFGSQGLSARIGPSTTYAPFLEFGTHRMAARPFMVPALELERGPFIEAIKKVVG